MSAKPSLSARYLDTAARRLAAGCVSDPALSDNKADEGSYSTSAAPACIGVNSMYVTNCGESEAQWAPDPGIATNFDDTYFLTVTGYRPEAVILY